jgi:mannosyl-oligosaccharide glucosidase
MFSVFSFYYFFVLFLVTYVWAADEQNSRPDNSSLIWGPYRPNLYFGVRPRIPRTLLMGLMWGQAGDFKSMQRGVYYSRGF